MSNLKPLATALKHSSQRVNLFSTSDREKLVSKHFPDALAIKPFWNIQPGNKVLDIGTGGGVPGLVLAVEYPQVDFTLLDSTQKKLDALEEVIQIVGLKNARTLWGRIEEKARETSHRERYDIVTARAVADLPVLLEYAVGFLKPYGNLYAWKSMDFAEELERSKFAQKELGLNFIRSHDYSLPGGESRSILCFRKAGPVNEKYPRRIGIPLKTPLV